MEKSKLIFVASVLLLLFFFFTTVSYAIGHPLGVQQDTSSTPRVGQQQACQARETAIKTRMTHLMDLVNTMETKFDSIASRVETYYTDKVVPSGKTVTNYAMYTQDIQVQKNDVQTAVGKAQSDVSSFSCASGDPKAQLTQFRVDMQTVKTALKNYRTSIKNLIVAVHSISEADPSESPKPTK